MFTEIQANVAEIVLVLSPYLSQTTTPPCKKNFTKQSHFKNSVRCYLGDIYRVFTVTLSVKNKPI
jgi:hypothetical protein